MAAPKGNKFSKGRPKGSVNKKTTKVIEACEASGITPLDYMLSVMRDAKNEQQVRMDAAKSAAPYVHARLANIESKTKVEIDGQQLIESFGAAILDAANVNK
jgi:hypothetical protein